MIMKPICWNEGKNEWLKQVRGISFDEVVVYILENKILAIKHHSNQQKYKKQKIFFVRMNGYVFMVPYGEDDEKIFLKTIIPSRKATKDYLNK